MGDVKPWQIVLFVAAVVVVGVSLGWMVLGGKRVDLPNEAVFADVSNGDLYTVNLRGRRSAMVPSKNPETGEWTLFPVERDESGAWRITERARFDFEAMDVDKSAVKDMATGEVEVSTGRRKKL